MTNPPAGSGPEPRVVLVVPSWNGKADTLECLHSLGRQSYQNLAIVVVDNGSSDGTVEAIRKQFPAVALICHSENQGFALAGNAGIRFALDGGAEYVGILNNDAVFDPEMVRELVRAAQADAQVAVVGPKVYYYGEPDVIWAAGGSVDFSEVVVSMRGYGQKDRKQFDAPADVGYIPGCGLLARASVVREVGPFDPAYFAYFEDVDWCWRMRRRGYRVRYVPSARMWHKVSRASGNYSPRQCYAMGVNAVRFMRNHARWHEWARWLLFAVLSLPFLYVVRAFQGTEKSVRAKALGIRDGLRGVRVTAETFRRRW